MLIIVCGLPGSGKTTLASAISQRLGAAHISSDITRKSLFANPSYTEREKSEVYSSMAKEATHMLSEGRDVVVDATFYRARERKRFTDLAADYGAQTHIIMTVLDEDEIRKRLAQRKKGGPSDADFSVYFKVKGLFEDVEERHIVIDSALPEREKLRLVLGFIGH